MSHTVIGIFEHSSEAQDAKQSLIENGFNSADIDINDSALASDDGMAESANLMDSTRQDRDNDSVGGFFKNLFSSDGEDDQRDKHIEAGRRGTVVTVYTNSSDEAEQAADMLDSFGAVDVDEYSGRSRDNMGFDTSSVPLAGSTTGTSMNPDNDAMMDSTVDSVYDSTNDSEMNLTPDPMVGSTNDSMSGSTADTTFGTANDSMLDSTNDTDKVQVIKEDMHVGKREVETGGMRLRSRIVERPVEESIRLRHEHVTVERNPVNRPATEADFAAFKEGTVEMIEHAEVPVISKEARVVEEISLGKEVEESDETVTGTVRNTEVSTEEIPGEETSRKTDMTL